MAAGSSDVGSTRRAQPDEDFNPPTSPTELLRRHITEPVTIALTLFGVIVASYLLAVLAPPQSAHAGAQADPGAELYASSCASCHQAGGEGIPGTFPPLAGNPAATDRDYVVTVITDGLSGPLEVLGETYDSSMPPVTTLAAAEIDTVADHVVELAGGTDEPATTLPPVEAPTTGEIDAGHDLFVGSDRFGEGAVACAACHTAGSVGNLGGNSLGPDLTDVFSKFGGEAGLAAWLTNPPSPTMMPIFSDRPLDEEEIAHLVAFLADAPDQNEPTDDFDGLVLAGLGGLMILIGGMAIAWRGMRQTYVEQLRSKR